MLATCPLPSTHLSEESVALEDEYSSLLRRAKDGLFLMLCLSPLPSSPCHSHVLLITAITLPPTALLSLFLQPLYFPFPSHRSVLSLSPLPPLTDSNTSPLYLYAH